MVRRLLKAAAVTVPLLVIAGAALYLLGVRVVLDGGGGVHLRVVESEEARAERIARHRSAQRADPAPPRADPGDAGSPAASPASARGAPTGSGTVPEIAPAAAPAVPAGLWPDFRGPKRDGHYTERAIRTDWPAAGLTPLWKQPVGGGFASFVAARGRAFTIEQRGGEEIVAAYDILTIACSCGRCRSTVPIDSCCSCRILPRPRWPASACGRTRCGNRSASAATSCFIRPLRRRGRPASTWRRAGRRSTPAASG
jgi:hypothetical protein